jgi:uncharacterized protein YpuA (DUF1002 family)
VSLNPTRDLREFVMTVYEQLSEVLKRLGHIEGKVKQMPTRQELDELKTELKQKIVDETSQVSADIQALKDQLARGEPITQDDLDDLRQAINAVGGIDPDAPAPAP